MEGKGQGNKEIFNEFLGQFVKVLFNDGEQKISKGKLAKVGEDFILIMGDFSQKIISINTILKIEKL